MRLTYAKPAAVNGDGLTAELATAGVPGATVLVDGNAVIVNVPDAAVAATVAATVAAHTGAAPPGDVSPAVAQAVTYITGLRPKALAVRAGTDNFTALELQRICAFVVLMASR